MSINVAAHARPAGTAQPHGHLRVVGGDPDINLVAAEQAGRVLLVALGRDPDTDHLRDTPRRVATRSPNC